jgi:predicted nucleotidyltransferase
MTELLDVVTAQPYPSFFATVSGAHLYGFPSADSDYDVRGAHILPARAVLGLDAGNETIEVAEDRGGVRVELVTHDVKKYFSLLLKRNGYVLEQIFSPLIVVTRPEHAELKAIAETCITREHAEHYLGFAEQQWKLIQKKGFRVKAVLYVYRVLLTGIHLMQTGIVEANLVRLNEQFRIPTVDDLVAKKITGHEETLLNDADVHFYEREYAALRSRLAEAQKSSRLPEEPAGREALNELLIRVRLGSL